MLDMRRRLHTYTGDEMRPTTTMARIRFNPADGDEIIFVNYEDGSRAQLDKDNPLYDQLLELLTSIRAQTARRARFAARTRGRELYSRM